MRTLAIWILLLPMGLILFALVWWDLAKRPNGRGVDELQTHPIPDDATVAS